MLRNVSMYTNRPNLLLKQVKQRIPCKIYNTNFPISSVTLRSIHVNHKKSHRKDSKEVSKLNKVNAELTRQLDALDKMTKQIKENIKMKEDEKIHNQVKDETVSLKDGAEVSDKDIDEVFASLGISPPEASNVEQIEALEEGSSNKSVDLQNPENILDLFPIPKTYVPIPQSIKQILSLEVVSNITTKETANWEPVVDTLLKSGICNPISNDITLGEEFTGYDFHQFVKVIPRNEKVKLVEKLHELALLSGVLWGNVHVMNDLLALTNLLPKERAVILMDTLLKEIELGSNSKKTGDNDTTGELEVHEDKIVANTTTKAIILNHYARMCDIANVRKYIALLNELPKEKNPMNTSPVIYTSIMQMYIRLNDYELAKETFDTMKFLSLKTSPSPHTYTSMMLMDTLNNNIEHGISVYEEMVEKNMKPEPEGLLALAKGCGARQGMVAQGWDFIIKYYENGYPVDSHVMEIMMYLAYVDCDLPFVRGIWMNICETNTKLNTEITLPRARCTKWLFNAYYKIGDILNRKKDEEKHVPVGLVDPRVKAIRTKVLELTNFGFHEQAPPLLPIVLFDGADSRLMLKEAKALWRYMTSYQDGSYISRETIEAYLYVIGRFDTLENFINEWEGLTIFDNEGIDSNDQEAHVTIEEPETNNETTANDEIKDAVVKEIRYKYPFGRVTRDDRLYSMCMHVARHQASLSFAQKIWTERGKYRKCAHFQKLSHAAQDNADFKFARLMMSTLTETGNVGDAYKLVLSSQNRFVWSKYHLNRLMSVCERMGFVTFSKELMKVVRRGDKWTRRQQRRQNNGYID